VLRFPIAPFLPPGVMPAVLQALLRTSIVALSMMSVKVAFLLKFIFNPIQQLSGLQ